MMTTVAFLVSLCIAAFGAYGLATPSGLGWIAQRAVSPGAFYIVAAVRVAFGLVLISAAPASRAPKAVRVLGYVIVVAGVGTALMGLLGIERARVIVEWWLRQGAGVVRLTGLLVMALGSFMAYACAPVRRVPAR